MNVKPAQLVLVLSVGMLAALPLGAKGAAITSLRLHVVARGLSEPVVAAFAPGDNARLYVGERRGTIRVIDNGRVERAPFLDIRSRVVGIAARNERGLLGLTFGPTFATDGRFYVSYTTATGDVRVAEMAERNGRIDRAHERTLLNVSQKPFRMWHFAGDLQFDRSGKLLVSTGDGGYWRQAVPGAKRARPLEGDPYGNSQNMAVPNAKLLAIDVTASTPTWSALAYGLRNPWRFSIDRESGDIWIGDVGFSRTEEVDVIRAGDPLLNFGWSVYEGRGSRNYRGVPPKLEPEGRLTWPSATYGHGQGDCSVIGGYVYRGSAIASWRGRYVFGDYCSGRVWSISASAPQAIRLEPVRIPRLTSFAEDSSGELYATSGDGTLFKVVP